MDFLCFLFFRFLHQTSAVSPPIAVAETKTTEGNLAGSLIVVTGVEFVAFCAPSNSPLGATIAPSGSLVTRGTSSGFVGLWTPPIRSLAIGPDGSRDTRSTLLNRFCCAQLTWRHNRARWNCVGGCTHPVHFGYLQLCSRNLPALAQPAPNQLSSSKAKLPAQRRILFSFAAPERRGCRLMRSVACPCDLSMKTR